MAEQCVPTRLHRSVRFGTAALTVAVAAWLTIPVRLQGLGFLLGPTSFVLGLIAMVVPDDGRNARLGRWLGVLAWLLVFVGSFVGPLSMLSSSNPRLIPP